MVYNVFLGKHPDNHPQCKKQNFVTHPRSPAHELHLNQSLSIPLQTPTSTTILIFMAIKFFIKKTVLSFKGESLDTTAYSCPI